MLGDRLSAACAAIILTLAASSTQAAAPLKGGQAPGWHRMRLGKFEITALWDGALAAPVDKFLHDISPAQEKALLERAYLKSPVETSINGFLVNTGSKLVLIDVGAGSLYGPTLGKLVGNLKASGYSTEQVDEVYLTHLHGDHVGGLVTADGGAVFPNAVVRADSRDTDYWLDEKNTQSAPPELQGMFKAAIVSIRPYAETGRLKPFAGATNLAPGIRAVPAYGHTPGHTIYVVESEGQRLVVWGDMMHVAAVEFPQPTVTWTESDPGLAKEQRLRNFADAASKGYYVALAHVAFPGIGRLRANGKGYVWVPAVYGTAGQ